MGILSAKKRKQVRVLIAFLRDTWFSKGMMVNRNRC